MIDGTSRAVRFGFDPSDCLGMILDGPREYEKKMAQRRPDDK